MSSNTFTQIHVHCVMAVKFRQSVIHSLWQERLHGYITGIVQNQGHKMIAINSMPGHLHMLIGLRPNQSLSDLMRVVKGDSSEWINKERFCQGVFRWQEGYGAFSYAKSDLNKVIDYIRNQEQHHKRFSFLEEYQCLLEKFEVEFDERYIFKLPE